MSTLSDDCGPYLPQFCNGNASQPDPSCPTACGLDSDCDANAHCDGVCTLDLGTGAACDEPSDCQSGSCVDGVCCTTACNGECERCDLAGWEGTCRNLAVGADPDNECGMVDCGGHYWGWQGDTCYERADAAAGAAGCDGAGACQDAADICGAQGQGTPATTCHDTCQDPNAATCTGTTAGVCTNVNPGTTTCGVGECEVTVNTCTAGAPTACTPSSPGTELCNDLDDDCDGDTDDNVPGAEDIWEWNDACASAANLGIVNETAPPAVWSPTIYPAGDEDYFEFYARKEFNWDCWPLIDTPTYTVQVTLIPPGGGDSVDYDLELYDGSCSWLGASAESGCASETVTVTWQGVCGLETDRVIRVHVDGYEGAFECVDYQLRVDMW